MKRVLGLLKKDITLGIKDMFILMEVGFAVVFLFVLLFIVPEDIRTEAMVYIYDESEIVEKFVTTINPDTEDMGEYFVDSREELIEGMEEDRLAIGMIIKGPDGDGKYKVELLKQPYTKEALVKYIEVEMEDLISIIKPPQGVYPMDVYDSYEIEALNYGKEDEVPFNKRILPPVLLFMVGIMGLFAMVSLTTQEKSEATIRVYRITPANMWLFLTSKYLMVLLTGIISFSILYIPTMGFSGYFESLLVMLLTVIFGSTVGVILAGFFDNVMTSILWVMLLMIVLALPAVSLLSPIFSPAWLKIIPTYHTLFAIDAAMFPADNSHLIWQGALILAIIDVVLFIVSGLIFKTTAKKEV